MLSPRDLDLLLVRSCSLSPSLSVARLLSELLRPLKHRSHQYTGKRLTRSHQHSWPWCALGLMQSKHWRNCTFCQALLGPLSPLLSIANRDGRSVHERVSPCYTAENTNFTHDTTRITTSHIHTHTREQRGGTTKHSTAALDSGDDDG